MQEYINGKVLIKGKLEQKDFLVKDNKVFFEYKKTDNPIDLTGKVVAPGFVEIHSHTRYPGFTHKEDLKTFEAAALAGGYTNLVAMGNVNPAPCNVKNIEDIQSVLNTSEVNIIQASRATCNQKVVDVNAISSKIKIFADDGLPISNKETMSEVLKAVKRNNATLLLHEEDAEIKGVAFESKFTKENGLPAFNSNYEVNMVKRDIELNKDINAKIHVQHASSKETIQLILNAQKDGMNISGELSPHHLFFSNEDITGSTNFKMNPPLNSKEDMLALREAFAKEQISIIATDHAPHTDEEKGDDWNKSPFGIIGLETAFSAVNTIFGEEHLEKTLRALTINPAKFIGLDIEIKNGSNLNLVIIDPNKKWVYKKEDIKSKSKNSPWINVELTGKVEEVLWNKI